MKTQLNHLIIFSIGGESDLFVTVRSIENNKEIAYRSITFKEILDNTFTIITNSKEQRLMKRKIKISLKKFLSENFKKV